MKVLFVCSGNICRSPMAAEYLRHRAALSGLAHVVVDSAGTLGIRDVPVSAEARKTCEEAGLDLSSHRSRGLTSADLRSSDLVVVMAQEHLEYLAEHYPEGHETRLVLRAFESGARPGVNAPDLDDPIGMPIEVYREQFQIIRTCIDHLVLHLRHRDPETADD